MTFIECIDNISVGFKLIDEQHKRLANLINARHEANEAGNTEGARDEISMYMSVLQCFLNTRLSELYHVPRCKSTLSM